MLLPIPTTHNLTSRYLDSIQVILTITLLHPGGIGNTEWRTWVPIKFATWHTFYPNKSGNSKVG